MPCGSTGRIVVVLDPATKLAFDAKLKEDGIAKKEWLRERILSYINGHPAAVQLSLPLLTAAVTPPAPSARPIGPSKVRSRPRPLKATLPKKLRRRTS